MALDSKMSCLCCDKPILIDSEKWFKMEMPIALCSSCNQTVPQATVKVLFILRSQVATLKNEIVLMKKDIERLYKAQQEFEEAIVREA